MQFNTHNMIAKDIDMIKGYGEGPKVKLHKVEGPLAYNINS